MKKSFFKVLLIATLAVTTAFSASAFDMETVESAAETETVVQAALTEESTDYVLDANGGEVELTFELGAELIIDTGKSEALCGRYESMCQDRRYRIFRRRYRNGRHSYQNRDFVWR